VSTPNERLARLAPTFTTAGAERVGLWRRDLYRLRDDGVVHELSRGVYRKDDAPETAHLDLLAVAHRAPGAVVCLLSALSLHELTDEIPTAVQVAVRRGAHRLRIVHPPTEVSEFDGATFDLGRIRAEVAPGERVPAYGAARTVVDVMRLRHRMGEPVAYRALRGSVRSHLAPAADTRLPPGATGTLPGPVPVSARNCATRLPGRTTPTGTALRNAARPRHPAISGSAAFTPASPPEECPVARHDGRPGYTGSPSANRRGISRKAG
jgi:hypothetical protein